MKSKIIILSILLGFSINVYSQCPGATAQSYKTKAQNAGSNTEATGAYVGLATYYAYKCECENGTDRGARLIDMINGLVATNSQYYKNKYGTISRVSSCKSKGSGGTENANSSTNSGDKSQTVKKETFLQSMSKGLGISENEISLLLEGNYEEALKNMNRNQNINNLAKDMNGNTALAGATYDLMNESVNALAEGIEQGNINKANSFIDLANSYKVIGDLKRTIYSYNYINDFSDENWIQVPNEYVVIENNSSNEIKVLINKEYNKKLYAYPQVSPR